MLRIGFTTIAVGAALAWTASAQELDPEITMQPIPNPAVELPAAVTELLALPESAAAMAVERSSPGLRTANDSRARAAENRAAGLARAAERRGSGVETAAEARERGAAFGADIAEAAMSSRENLVRGGGEMNLPIPVDLPSLPEHVPGRPDVVPPVELPDRPDLPGQAGGGA